MLADIIGPMIQALHLAPTPCGFVIGHLVVSVLRSFKQKSVQCECIASGTDEKIR